MALCDELLEELIPDCKAFKKVGGTKGYFYIGNRSALNDAAPFTIDSTTKEMTALALKANKYLRRFEGRKEKNNGTYALAPGEVIDSWTQSFNALLYHYTQLERNTINSLRGQDDLFVIVPTAEGQFEVFGLSVEGKLEGLKMTSGTGGTGTVINDSTATAVTFSGGNTELPILFSKGTVAATVTYLEGLREPEA